MLGDHPFLFIMISLALGYPLGRVRFVGITLGTVAGSLLVGLVLSNIAFLGFGLRYQMPGLMSTFALMLFMYAIGLRVGPQFFSGLARNGVGLIVMSVIAALSGWLIAVVGAKLAGLAPGFIPGILGGSFTVTAALGVAQTALTSGAYTPPQGMSTETVLGNMSAGYAVSYLLSQIFTILLIKYLPRLFGRDPVAAGREAEEAYGAGRGAAPLPGTDEAFVLGYSPMDIRAYRLEYEPWIGRKPSELFEKEWVPILRIIRAGEVLDLEEDPPLERGDIITVRADVSEHIADGRQVGPEVADDRARQVEIEAAEVVVGNKSYAGRTIDELGREFGYGLYLHALFREGESMPVLPDVKVEVGDVLRLSGPAQVIDYVAQELGSRPVRATTATEVASMAIAIAVGYAIGLITINIGGIPFSLGAAAGVMLAGILVATLRARNPLFGGPVNEGARSLLQDFGLSVFVAVLGANVGPSIIDAFQGPTVIWIVVIGLAAALLPAVFAWLYGFYVLKMNTAVLIGAVAGARVHTVSLRAAQEETQSITPAIGFPVPYALSTVLILIGGYLSMILS
ncbi:MAG TPA: transporter [Anaerolineae bacterium]|nr:transporter [Anaerolineae bacterium]